MGVTNRAHRVDIVLIAVQDPPAAVTRSTWPATNSGVRPTGRRPRRPAAPGYGARAGAGSRSGGSRNLGGYRSAGRRIAPSGRSAIPALLLFRGDAVGTGSSQRHPGFRSPVEAEDRQRKRGHPVGINGPAPSPRGA